MIEQTLSMLGRRATDKVTGFSGVVTSVCFDLYGCVQAILTPPVGKSGEKTLGEWFDVKRLDLKDALVMDRPNFGVRFGEEAGPELKPAFDTRPQP